MIAEFLQAHTYPTPPHRVDYTPAASDMREETHATATSSPPWVGATRLRAEGYPFVVRNGALTTSTASKQMSMRAPVKLASDDTLSRTSPASAIVFSRNCLAKTCGSTIVTPAFSRKTAFSLHPISFRFAVSIPRVWRHMNTSYKLPRARLAHAQLPSPVNRCGPYRAKRSLRARSAVFHGGKSCQLGLRVLAHRLSKTYATIKYDPEKLYYSCPSASVSWRRRALSTVCNVTSGSNGDASPHPFTWSSKRPSS